VRSPKNSSAKLRNSNGQPGDSRNRISPLEARLDHKERDLGANRRELIRRIANESAETYFLSSRELAKRYHVDVGTIVRTIQALGYERYADFKSDLRAHFVVRLNPYNVMKASEHRGHRSVLDHIRDCVELGANNLDALRSELDPRQIRELAKRISRARRVVIVGVDLASALSYYFYYMLLAYGFDAEAPVGSATQLNQRVSMLKPEDLLIAISFGRCLRTTVEAAIHARQRNVPTFGLTDSNRSPIARHCDSFLLMPTASAELSISYVAPVSAIEAIMTACAYLDSKRSLRVLKRKTTWEEPARWYAET
jgi:DNA-binding MurR/RpiR family transcriptional regulator